MKFWYDGYYDTMRGHARRRGISFNTIDMRVWRYGNRPENYDRILHVGTLSRRTIVFGGKLTNVAEAARRLGLNPNAVYQRIFRGMSAEDALRMPLRIPQRTKRTRKVYAPGVIPKGARFEYRGIVDTLRGHALRLGVSPGTVTIRAKTCGRRYDKLDVLLSTERDMGRYPLVLYRGQLATLTGHCRRLGLPKTAVLSRVRKRGFTPKESLDIAMNGERVYGSGHRLNGEIRSVESWARRARMSAKAVRRRLKRGATLAQALARGSWRAKPVTDARSKPVKTRRSRELAALGIIL